MNNRIFYPDALNHCYQRSHDHGVLFYTVRDHLVYFSIFCVMAQRHNVHVIKLVQMPNHTHHSNFVQTRKQLCDFSRDLTSTFARERNRTFGLKGPVFETPFSSAVKRSDKNIRTCLIYLDNNPVERKLAKRAEEYRWNYLAYSQSNHPFSEKLTLRNASMPLRRAIASVKRMHSQGRYLGYRFLEKLFENISTKREQNQLIDFIVSTYSVIDHAAAIQYFDCYERELIAAHATKGSEYDIKEPFIGKSDACFARFSAILLKKGCCTDIHELLSWSPEKKMEMAELLQRETSAPRRLVSAYLHLPVDAIV